MYNPNRAEHGWESSHTVVQVLTDDMPFLVDSVTIAISACDNFVHSVVHPVVQVDRDAGGHVLGMHEESAAGGRGKAESFMHFEIDRRADPEEMARLAAAVQHALADVRACVRDWASMRAKMHEIAEDLASRPLPIDAAARVELQEFLRWAANDHFTFLGYREYTTVHQGSEDVLLAVDGSGLGILRGQEARPRSLKSLAARDVPDSEGGKVVIITKTNARSNVHRPGYMDYIGILRFDGNGKPVAVTKSA